MKACVLTLLATAAFVAVACQQEAAPPPMPAPAPMAPQAMQPQAQAQAVPAAPTVVYASADPQHGGITQKVGDYMVELATGNEGRVDFYVTKYEGATPSFENVQLGVVAASKTETTDKGLPLSQHVVFYPKDGKLQGTVAGMQKGSYDFHVAIHELATKNVAEGTFADVEIDPFKTEMRAKHDGTVYLVEKAKMEIVQEDNKIKVYLRALDDTPLATEGNDIEDVTIGIGEEGEETVDLEPVGDHYEGEIESEIPEDDEVELKLLHALIDDEKYNNMRMGPVPRVRLRARKDLKLTQSEAKKLDHPKEMKGTIGSMKVGAKPEPKPEPATGKKTKTSKGPMTKGKKAGASSGGSKGKGKKTKTSKGPMTKGKKAK